jgi:hypothetical protein
MVRSEHVAVAVAVPIAVNVNVDVDVYDHADVNVFGSPRR